MKLFNKKDTQELYDLIKDTFDDEKFTHARFHNRVDKYCREKGIRLYKEPTRDYLGLSIERRNEEISRLKNRLNQETKFSEIKAINIKIKETENSIKVDVR